MDFLLYCQNDCCCFSLGSMFRRCPAVPCPTLVKGFKDSSTLTWDVLSSHDHCRSVVILGVNAPLGNCSLRFWFRRWVVTIVPPFSQLGIVIICGNYLYIPTSLSCYLLQLGCFVPHSGNSLINFAVLTPTEGCLDKKICEPFCTQKPRLRSEPRPSPVGSRLKIGLEIWQAQALESRA